MRLVIDARLARLLLHFGDKPRGLRRLPAKLAKAAVDRMRAGFRDNTWLLQTKGTDYDVAPPASKKVPLIATIYAEADGQPLPLPDPADPTKKEFSWMTAHKYTADRAVPYTWVGRVIAACRGAQASGVSLATEKPEVK